MPREPSAPPDGSTDKGALDFWLANLSGTDAFTRWVLDEVSPWLGDRVLEVGCGMGTYTAAMADGRRRIVAVDIDESYIEAARLRLGSRSDICVMRSDVRQLSMPSPADQETSGQAFDTAFDTIVMFDVLEHIEDDVGILAQLRERLRDGGHLILKVPAGPWLYSPMDRAIGHWRRYDKAGLRHVMKHAGYEIVAIWPFNGLAAPGWWWNGRVRKRSVPPAGQVALFNRLVPILRPLDQVARHLCGVSLLAVGRRSDNSRSGSGSNRA